MSKYVIDSETLTDIADAIRAKTGDSASMTPLEMPDEIASISGGGGYAPSGYTRLKYLQATGTQYIDTGKYLKLNSEFWCDMRYSEGAQGAFAFPFGSNNPIVGTPVINTITGLGTANAYVSFGSNVDKRYNANGHYWNRFQVETNKDASTVTMTLIEGSYIVTLTCELSDTTVTENTTSHIGLFCRGNRGTFERFFKGYIYEYKYSESGVLQNDVFYTNDGTGDFIGGAWE